MGENESGQREGAPDDVSWLLEGGELVEAPQDEGKEEKG